MTSSELKLKAKELLMGKKKDAALMVFVMMLILMVVNGILERIFPGRTTTIGDMEVTSSSTIASILYLAVTVFLTLGELSYFMKIARGETPELKELFSKRNLIPKVFITTIISTIIIGLGFIVLIIPGIILGLAYSMFELIYLDNPEIGIIDVLKESRMMMKGHKWEYFCLMLSFIGWIILSVFTLGILLLWLTPYMGVTSILFYDSIRGAKTTEVEKVEEVAEPNE